MINYIKHFYVVNKHTMETNPIYLSTIITISLLVYFFSRKSITISLFPLVCMIFRFASLNALNNTVTHYFNSSLLRFLISSYFLTLLLITSIKLLLLGIVGFYILSFTDKYYNIFYMKTYNIMIITGVIVLLFYIKKFQEELFVFICALYSSVLLLNSLEILLKIDIGIKSIEPMALFLILVFTFGSFMIQNTSIRKNIKKT